MSRASLIVYAVSIGLHVAGAWAMSLVERQTLRAPTSISFVDLPAPGPPPPASGPPPLVPEASPAPEAPKPAPVRKAPAVAKPSAPPTPAALPPLAPPPSFGLALSNASAAGTGIAVPVGDPSSPVSKGPVQRVLEADPPAAKPSTCDAPDTKPSPLHTPQPAFPDEARAAGVAGKVRLRLTVGVDGLVSDVSLVEGLGHGLDEAAIAAVRTWRFEPATRCGAPDSATFTLSVRFVP